MLNDHVGHVAESQEVIPIMSQRLGLVVLLLIVVHLGQVLAIVVGYNKFQFILLVVVIYLTGWEMVLIGMHCMVMVVIRLATTCMVMGVLAVLMLCGIFISVHTGTLQTLVTVVMNRIQVVVVTFNSKVGI
jgi:hypothetical protein